MGLVSIIVPCYNYGWLLAETLDSVLAQTYQHWECLIIDDGSTDSTQAVATSYQARDSRFRYAYQPNGGLSAARNYGMQLAKGKYIQFLDADDLLLPQKLELQVDLLATHPEYNVVYSAVRYFMHGEPDKLSRSFDMKDTHWQVELSGQGNEVVATMLPRNIMVVNAPLLRTDLCRRVGSFKVEIRALEDWDFWLRCALNGAYFCYDGRPESWALVRIHPTSMSQNMPRMLLFEEKVRASLTKPLYRAGLSEAAALNKKLLQQLRKHNAQHLLRSGELRQGLGKYWQMARESGHYILHLREALYVLRHRSA